MIRRKYPFEHAVFDLKIMPPVDKFGNLAALVCVEPLDGESFLTAPRKLNVFDIESGWRTFCQGLAQSNSGNFALWFNMAEQIVSAVARDSEILAAAWGVDTSAYDQEWPEIIPFSETEVPPFPDDAFPEPVAEFCRDQAWETQVSPDMTGALMIGTVAGCLQGKGVIKIHNGWKEQPSLNPVVVLPSGERKSAEFSHVLRPVFDVQRERHAAAGQEIVEATAKLDELKAEAKTLKAQIAEAKKSGKSAEPGEDGRTPAEVLEALTRQIADFAIPAMPQLIADDITTEAAGVTMEEQGGRLIIASPEGGWLATIAGRYSDRMANVDLVLKGYSGDTYTVNRIGRGHIFIEKPELSVILAVQPDVLDEIGANRAFKGRGLLARMLFVMAPQMMGHRITDVALVHQGVRDAWNDRIEAILNLPDAEANDPHYFLLDEAAHDRFWQFRDEVEERLNVGGDLEPMADWAGKLCGNVCRLAMALHTLERVLYDSAPWNTRIDLATMEAAIRLGNYFADHAKAAYWRMGIGGRDSDAQYVVDSLKLLGQASISQRDLYRSVRRRFHAVDDLASVLGYLADLGYIRVESAPAGGRGRPASPQITVNPQIFGWAKTNA